MLHLANIPEDALIHIVSYLELDDLWRLRQVCTRVRTITSTDQVWRTASSRLGLLLRGSAPATNSWAASSPSAFPDPLIRDIWRAARVDSRWSAARSCGSVGYPSPDGTTWSYVRLAGGEWVLCTDERGDVTATHLAQVISPSPERPKDGAVYESDFDPYCTCTSLVDWFRNPAILIIQLRSSYRSLSVRCFGLPSTDSLAPSPSPTERLFQYNLGLGVVSVLAVQVDVARRCLMILCRDLNHGPRDVHLEVWRWGLDEEQPRLPPRCAMRTAPFKAADCEFCLVETKEGSHVFIVRASEETTHFEFYDLLEPEDVPGRAESEPEPRMPVASASLPCVCHQITLPQSGTGASAIADAGNSTSVLLCAARSPKRSELLAYRVSLHRRNVRLSLLGGHMLPEYGDVLDCVLGARGMRGIASIAGPRTGTPVELALLTCRDDHFQVRMLKEPIFEAHRPMRLGFDEIQGTIVFLDDEGNMHVIPFDSELRVHTH